MATAVTMPRLGLTMVEGTVVEWKAQPGDSVEKGQILLVIESEKVEVEVEAFSGGTLAAIYVEPGTTVPIGSLLGAVADRGESFDREAFEREFVPELEGAPAGASAAGGGVAPEAMSAPARAPQSGVKAAPAARALAKKLGVDLESIAGSGPGGRITLEDVERAGSAEPVLSIDAEGSGPPLLMISGFGVDKTSWRRQIDALRGNFTAIAYDPRGIGASRPMPTDSLTIAAMAEEALAAAGERAPFTVVGASMGAAIAIELALARPSAVAALVLITPPIAKDARLDAVLRASLEFESPQAEGRIRAMLPWFLSRRFLAETPKREAAAQALRAMAARTPLPTLRRHANAFGAWLGTRSGDLSRIAVPTLVIAGSEDVLVSGFHAEQVAASLPGARLEVLEGAGHAVTIECADQVNQLVAEFARRR
jgi:pyruvate dehydrogenase E2 component (dihydrolipoamide acetyltransferase)